MKTQSTFSEFKRSLKKNLKLKLAPNGRYDLNAYWSALFCAVERSTTVEDACALLMQGGLEVPSQDTVLEAVKGFSVKELQAGCDAVIQSQIRAAKSCGRLPRKVVVVMDCHDYPYYGSKRDCKWVVGGKMQHGTRYFNRVATASIVENGRRFTVAVLPVCKGMKVRDIVEHLLSKVVENFSIRYAMMDKGFYSSAVLRLLKRRRVHYIIAGKAYKRFILLGKQHGKRDFRAECEVGDCQGNRVPTTVLSHYDRESRMRRWYLTDMRISPATADHRYDARWGIETSYRVTGETEAWTTSNSISVRLFIRMLSIAVYNLWILTNLLADVGVVTYRRREKLIEKTVYAITHKSLARALASFFLMDTG